ncbi:hypothetical protein ACWC2T_45760 [Streptomyces sp. NPDC001393]
MAGSGAAAVDGVAATVVGVGSSAFSAVGSGLLAGSVRQCRACRGGGQGSGCVGPFHGHLGRGRRGDCCGISSGAYPPPGGADDEELHEHQRMVRWATNQAMELVEEASRRIVAGYERDLEALADEITQQNVLVGTTTVTARTLLVGEFLTAKLGGYPPPKRFMDLLMLKPQLRRPQKMLTANAGLLPFD